MGIAIVTFLIFVFSSSCDGSNSGGGGGDDFSKIHVEKPKLPELRGRP